MMRQAGGWGQEVVDSGFRQTWCLCFDRVCVSSLALDSRCRSLPSVSVFRFYYSSFSLLLHSMVNFYYFNLCAFNAIEFLYLFSFYKFCVDVNKDRMKIFFYKSLEKGVQTQLNKSLRNVRQLLRIFVKYFYTIVFINR